MNQASKPSRHIPLVPALVFLCGVMLPGAAAYYQRQSIDKVAREEFERVALRGAAEIAHRLERVEYALEVAMADMDFERALPLCRELVTAFTPNGSTT